MSSRQLKYKIYPSLLDSYQNYLDSDKNWEKFYGMSDEPKITIDEYEEKCKKELIDKINRVPFDNPAADKGTAFNIIVDCIKDRTKSDKIKVGREYEKKVSGTFSHVGSEMSGDVEFTGKVLGYNVTYNNREFYFPIQLCNEFAHYYKGSLSQVYTEAILPTEYGDVLLYGFIDELMPDSVHDIKTTSKYYSDKYKKGWQRYVYPYCLNKQGNDIHTFEFNATDFRNTYTESYTYKEERDIPILTDFVESFIEFLLANKSLITDKKIFNQ